MTPAAVHLRTAPPDARHPMERIYQANNLPEAYLLRGLLAQAGIDVRIFNENAQGAMGEIPFTQAYPELWLADMGRRDEALAIIAGYEHNSTVSRDCPCCGEENPQTFELCWHCGKQLP